MHGDLLVAETRELRDDSRRLSRRATTATDTARQHRHRARQHRLRYIHCRAAFLARRPSTTSPVVRRVIDIVSRRFAQPTTLVRLSAVVGLSPWHLNVVFHRSTGMTIHEYATSLRMLRAATEIARGVKIEAVASGVGYRSRQSFYRQFKAWFGVNPTVLRPDR